MQEVHGLSQKGIGEGRMAASNMYFGVEMSQVGKSQRTLTLRALVLGITSVLGVIVLALCANMLWDAIQQYKTAQRILDVQRVGAILVKSGDEWDAERSAIIMALRDSPKATQAVLDDIRKHREAADAYFVQGLAALRKTAGFTDQEMVISRSEEMRPKMAAFHKAIEANLAKPLAERDPKLLPDWFTEMGSFISRTQQVRTRLEQATVHIDGIYGILVAIGQYAWTAGEFTNREWFVMDGAIDSKRPMTGAEQAQAGLFRGRVEQAMSLLRGYVIADNTPEEFRKEIDRVDQQFVLPFGKTRTGVLAASMKDGAYSTDSDNWFKQVDRVHDELMGITAKGQAAMSRHADDLSAKAMWEIAQASIVTLLGLLMAIAGIWVAMARVSRPLNNITHAMSSLAAGDKATEVPYLERSDEVGAMAKALDIFKRGAIEKERLEEEQAALAMAEKSRQQRMEETIRLFDGQMQAVLHAVSDAATELQATAEGMSSAAEETSRQATSVAAASEEASVNVQTVAAAAEELAASVQEVGSQASQSSQIAQNAVRQAAETDGKIDGLSDAVTKIGEVARLINDIASQTNLLALNATIEAARAGEAGKGFAVVASEVKNLASQTAKATEEITSQIAMVQTATAEVIQAITTVRNSIAETNTVAASIAAAVEEQSATTEEIARHAKLAAQGGARITQAIEGVANAASQTRSGADETLAAARRLKDASNGLKAVVAGFKLA
jgi:methyl-accepting chemotaxis protein